MGTLHFSYCIDDGKNSTVSTVSLWIKKNVEEDQNLTVNGDCIIGEMGLYQIDGTYKCDEKCRYNDYQDHPGIYLKCGFYDKRPKHCIPNEPNLVILNMTTTSNCTNINIVEKLNLKAHQEHVCEQNNQ